MMRVLLNAIHVKVLVILIASVAVTIVIVNGVVVDVWMMMKTMTAMVVMVVMVVMRVISVIADIRNVMPVVAHSHVVALMSVVDGVDVTIMLSK